MILKPSDRETPSWDFACLQQLSEGVSHNMKEKSLSSVSELFLSSLDNLLKDAYIIFQKGVGNFKIEPKYANYWFVVWYPL